MNLNHWLENIKRLNKRIHPNTFETISDVVLFDLEKAAQHG